MIDINREYHFNFFFLRIDLAYFYSRFNNTDDNLL